jgi:hypothetical protein
LRKSLLLATAAALVTGACDSPTAGGSARVSVLLTDAPHEYLDAAVVDIGRIELVRAGGPAVVIATEGGTFDLLDLQNGVTALLGEATMEPGRFVQLRLVVTAAELTLKAPYTFMDGTTTKSLAVPSGFQSGIKVNLSSADATSAGVEIRPGETILVVDFDVSQNFVMQGKPTAEDKVSGFLFTPLLRAVVRDIAGSIAGNVTAPQGVAVAGLTVTAVREGAPEGEAAATTTVQEDGTFKLHYLMPGTYEVTIVEPPAGHTVNTANVVVGDSQHVTGVTLTITPS